ncbi:MAG TPA: sodium-dependent bicarbonate transport family permease [Kiritimatiellia bacterium]|nr:sodium-dependent bicarbonate transport family permease [Kiritimatiellia bacterium]HMO98301.1 sodium-dependent bicarbonate transport family permease [Kiritimatiellia bacterium]HMP95503.1 sodium-dependent bicarbonate transport family permease [Kiritimatiellia bacterium]
MDPHLIFDNLLQPPILFFALGMLAVAVRSDLAIPDALARLFSLYLLLSIGFKGGVKLAESGLSMDAVKAVAAGLAMSAIVPVYTFFIFRRMVSTPNAAAIAAAYGSISAVTFLTAMTFLIRQDVAFGGYMVAVVALMESPAIIIGVMLYRRFGAEADPAMRKRELVRESLTNSSVFLLLGSMLIGVLSGSRGWEAMEPFTDNLFQGMLCFFLLEMGIRSARQLEEIRRAGLPLGIAAVALPLINGLLGLLLARALNMNQGDAILFCILAGSASYIAVPAAMRHAIPDANPGLYVSMALAITFPFNIAIGIPLYTYLVGLLWGGL